MSRPLTPKKQTERDRATYHHDVFEYWGRKCYLCPRKEPPTDCAHVLGCAHLGPKLRFASVHFARPAHRDCHDRVDGRARPFMEWPLAIRRDAVKHYNELGKLKLEMPR